MARCYGLLRDAIDLHTHSSPSFFDRLLAKIRLMVVENPARLLGLD